LSLATPEKTDRILPCHYPTHLAGRLKKVNAPVSLLVTADAAAGPESDNIIRAVPSNVDENINMYQTNPSMVRSYGDKK